MSSCKEEGRLEKRLKGCGGLGRGKEVLGDVEGVRKESGRGEFKMYV